jgi:phosphatidylserine/phosphatidylglycerophosphate/cardiolipin synthase-like enzyme
MYKHLLTSLCVALLFSCTSQRASRKKSPDVSSNRSDSISIRQALSLGQENMNAKTGIFTLENGGESLLARLWLFAHAKKSIDIQYYSFSKDITGLIATDYIIRAADRGVKIRLLIDDGASRMRNDEIQLLESHENIEIRIYNAGIKLGRPDRKARKSAKNIDRMTRRMHNKTLTIDDELTIIGGRNIADEYFDYKKKFNFRDRELMLVGEAVSEVKHSFDEFWNDKLTVPFKELSGKSKKWHNDPGRFDRLHTKAANEKKFSSGMRAKINTFPQLFTEHPNSVPLIWLNKVSFISDKPGKNEDREPRKGGICTDSIISLIKNAKVSLDIQSPYFIMTDGAEQLFGETIQRGVKIRILTNSLASTDQAATFSGYKKERDKILELGIEVYEYKPHPEVRFELMIPEVQQRYNYKGVLGLHSKSMIIDGTVSVIGSYNFDPRSADYNTECIAVMRSPEVAKHLSKFVNEEFLPANAWPITKECNPDSKATLKRRIKAVIYKVIPEKFL